MNEIERHLEERYARSFGRVAGYLPRNRAAVDEFQQNIVKSIAPGGELQSPAVTDRSAPHWGYFSYGGSSMAVVFQRPRLFNASRFLRTPEIRMMAHRFL